MSTAYDGSTAVLAITFPGVNLYPTWMIGANWVHTFSPIAGEFRPHWIYANQMDRGLPGDPTGAVWNCRQCQSRHRVSQPARTTGLQTRASVNGNISNVGTSAYNGNGLIDNTYSYIDDLTWQRGRHYLSMGSRGLRYQNNYPTGNNDGYLGSLNYTGAFTANPSATQCRRIRRARISCWTAYQSAGVTLGSVNVGQRQWRIGRLCAGRLQDHAAT